MDMGCDVGMSNYFDATFTLPFFIWQKGMLGYRCGQEGFHTLLSSRVEMGDDMGCDMGMDKYIPLQPHSYRCADRDIQAISYPFQLMSGNG